MARRINLSKIGHSPDYFLIALLFILTLAGLVILASASSNLGKQHYNDSYYYLKHQLIYGLLIGIIGYFFASRIHYQSYRTLSFIFLLVTIGLLMLVFTRFGLSSGGSSRWLRFGPVIFQPSEILKLTFIVYIAAWLSNATMNRITNFSEGILPFFIISGLVAGLLLLQPATSMVFILVFAGLAMYFVSGASLKHILLVFAVGAAIIAAIIGSTPYRRQRISTFLHPSSDTQGSGYQINQALIAIGSGGIWGVGYGESTSKVTTLPTPVGDSIFAVAAQELGFVGAATLVVLFLLLVYRFFWIARRVRDQFGHLLMVGFGSIIAIQSIVNIGAISGFFPLTGVPLPFVSYGGTALAVFLTMGGIATNVSKYT